ncbi:MAG TPA: sigma-70 family RNA polymerase sigma factor [Bacteroidetes bacterium]|nr:sigma-70 family RNA polymerase sigma factor [Bacteroidota bacterium]
MSKIFFFCLVLGIQMKSTVLMTIDPNDDIGIIKAIQGSMQERNKVLTYLFEEAGWEQMIVAYVVNHGGTAEQGHFVASETLIAFDRNIRNNKFRKESSLKTYYYSIARNRWCSLLKKKGKSDECLSLDEKLNELFYEMEEVSEERMKLIQTIAGLLGEECEKVFKLTANDMNRSDMAETLGLADAHIASKKLGRCRKRMSLLFKENPHLWDKINQ